VTAPWTLSAVALEKRTDTLKPALPVARPGVAYQPTANTPHLRTALLAAGSDMASIGEDGTTRHRGIYQLSVVYPSGKGVGALLTKADAVANHFSRQRLTEGAVAVQCEVPQLGPVIYEADWVSVPVSVPFFVTV